MFQLQAASRKATLRALGAHRIKISPRLEFSFQRTLNMYVNKFVYDMP